MNIYFKQLQSMGLSESQINSLDKMDGKSDQQISQSIFTSAKTLLNGDSPDKAIAQHRGDESLIRTIANILFGGQTSETTETADRTTGAKETPEQKEENQAKAKMQPLLDNAAQYFEQKGSLKGFAFKGLPLGIYHIEFAGESGYDDASNDVYKIGNNGKGSVDRKADSFKLILNFEYRTEGGSSKTVSIEKQLKRIPKQPELAANGSWDIYKEETK